MKKPRIRFRFSAAYKARLRAEQTGLSDQSIAQLIRETEPHLTIFGLLNERHDKERVDQLLTNVRKICAASIKLSETVIWPESKNFRAVEVRASQRLFQACSYQIMLEGSRASELKRQFLAKTEIPAANLSRLVSADDLSNARYVLYATLVADEEAQLLKGCLVGVATALDQAAHLALKIGAKGRGRKRPEDLHSLVSKLKAVFEKVQPKLTKGRLGPFGRYLTLCLEAAGHPQRDIMPILEMALGKRPSLSEQRKAQYKSGMQPDLLRTVWKKGR